MNTQAAIQPVVEHLHDKPKVVAHGFSAVVAVGSAWSWEAWGLIVSILGILLTNGILFYFRRKDDKRKERETEAAIRADNAKAENFGRRSTDDPKPPDPPR